MGEINLARICGNMKSLLRGAERQQILHRSSSKIQNYCKVIDQLLSSCFLFLHSSLYCVPSPISRSSTTIDGENYFSSCAENTVGTYFDSITSSEGLMPFI